MTQREEEVRELLSRLNHWEQRYGTAHKDDSLSTDNGEANARIASLKEALAEKGAVFHWDGAEYVLDSLAEPGRGGELSPKD